MVFIEVTLSSWISQSIWSPCVLPIENVGEGLDYRQSLQIIGSNSGSPCNCCFPKSHTMSSPRICFCCWSCTWHFIRGHLKVVRPELVPELAELLLPATPQHRGAAVVFLGRAAVLDLNCSCSFD